jgi:acyl-CoA thioesterase
MERRYNNLLQQLADIERQQQDPTLSHSDQQLLDQAWDDINEQLDHLDDILDASTIEWQDATEYIEEEEDDDATIETLSVPDKERDEEEEAYQAWLASSGCERCSGCAYCESSGGYDPTGEV